MTTVSMNFAALELTLAVGFKIVPEEFPKFRARIKQLQRLGFPPGINIGRGGKMSYKTEHLTKLAVAFALLDSGLTAKLVTELVEREWMAISSGIWAARIASEKSSDVFCLVQMNALSDVSGQEAKVTIEDEFSLANQEGAVRHGHSRPSFILVNLASLLRRLMTSSQDAARLNSFFIGQEIKEWRTEPPRFELWSKNDEWYRVGQFDSEGVIKLASDPQA